MNMAMMTLGGSCTRRRTRWMAKKVGQLFLVLWI